MKFVYWFILVEAGLELIPEEIWNHPQVKRFAEKKGKSPGELLLDVSYHHAAMASLPFKWKRGRPDIVHYFLLNTLDHPFGRKGILRVAVHTRNGELILFEPGTRIPKNYERFCGLMAQVLKEKETPLVKTCEKKIEDFLSELERNGFQIFLLHENGEREWKVPEKAVFLIGGFQKGEYEYDWPGEMISVAKEPLPVWIVASELICRIKTSLGLSL